MSELNGLPVVTADDNGKLLTVVDGEWKPSFSYSYKVMSNPEEEPRLVAVNSGGDLFYPVFVPSLKIGPINVCYFEGTEQDGYTFMSALPTLRFALMESEAMDPSDVPVDYDLFSEAGIPFIEDLSWYGVILIEEKYRDKLIPGEGSDPGIEN